jgi:aldose sugar dehydrogenase
MLRFALFLYGTLLILAQCSRMSAAEGILYRSKKHFQENCASCHGTDATAFVQKPWTHGNSRLELLQSMKGGIPNVPNHDFSARLNDKQRLYLADYLLQLMVEQKEARLQAASPKDNRFASEGMAVVLDTVARELENPWGMAFLPNNDLLVTERSGKLWRIDAKTRQKTEITGVPASLAESQGGLLDIELHPRFESNKVIYLTYSKYKDSLDAQYSTTAVFRGNLQGDSLVGGRDIFVALPYTKTRYHYGSRLEFDRQNYLFVSVGDRGMQDSFPQRLDKFHGKIHRIHDDGSIPDDNPFVGIAGAVPSIWSYGHRNPQGLAIHPITGVLWETEHGPRGGDEVNMVQRGFNYGWPVVSYGTHYDGRSFTEVTTKEGIAGPMDYWVPSIAPCGLVFCMSERYPAWQGDLLAGSLRFKYLDRCDIGPDGQGLLGHEALLPQLGRMRCIATDREGYLYVAVEEPGYIFRLKPVK